MEPINLSASYDKPIYRVDPRTIKPVSELITVDSDIFKLMTTTKIILSHYRPEGQAQTSINLIKSINELVTCLRCTNNYCEKKHHLLIQLLELTHNLNAVGNLQWLDLSGQDLMGMQFSPEYLCVNPNDEKENPIVLDMAHAKFNNAKMQSAVLDGVILHHAQFVDAEMESVNMSYAHIEEADFTRAKMNRAVMVKAHANRAIFTLAQVTNANLQDADLSDTDLSATNFTNSDMRGINTDRAIKFETNITGVGTFAHTENAKNRDVRQKRNNQNCTIS